METFSWLNNAIVRKKSFTKAEVIKFRNYVCVCVLECNFLFVSLTGLKSELCDFTFPAALNIFYCTYTELFI